MTRAHVAATYFDASREAAKKRLQKMIAAGLIRERRRGINEPGVLFLTRAASSFSTIKVSLVTIPR